MGEGEENTEDSKEEEEDSLRAALEALKKEEDVEHNRHVLRMDNMKAIMTTEVATHQEAIRTLSEKRKSLTDTIERLKVDARGAAQRQRIS